MRNKLRSPLAIVAVGVMVFASVFAAASSLTVSNGTLPQSGSAATADCDTDGVAVGYTVSGTNVTKIVVTDDECASGTITISTTAGYTFVESATQSNAATVNYTLGAVGGAASPISIVTFNPGTVTVTLVP